jgi:hypothetical protein
LENIHLEDGERDGKISLRQIIEGKVVRMGGGWN